MKTTLDLPEALVSAIQRRAVQERRDVKDVVADLLTAGMSPATTAPADSNRVVAKTLPLIKVRPAQPVDARRLTTQEWCDWLKDVDSQLEVERYEKAFGHQYVDRADA